MEIGDGPLGSVTQQSYSAVGTRWPFVYEKWVVEFERRDAEAQGCKGSSASATLPLCLAAFLRFSLLAR